MAATKILLIEPYYGGSHKQFLDGLVEHLEGDFTLLSLPPRKWKMRMQLAAPWFIEQLLMMERQQRHYDIVLFSTFIDVAVFKALACSVDGWNSDCRYYTYFHENQFCYPGYLAEHTSHQFTAINFSTALVSDRIAFNSLFNRDSFLEHCRKYLAQAVDMQLLESLDGLWAKSSVLYPGLDFSEIDRIRSPREHQETKLIVWNHRWEHDKNPEEFFDTLYDLQNNGIDFRLCLMGQSFSRVPDCFDVARSRLSERLVHIGYVEDRDRYYHYLMEADIVVSTAVHEFFGISVIEAVRAGCRPVLPRRLSYPELFGEPFLYEEGGLYGHLLGLLQGDTGFSRELAVEMTEPYRWEARKGDFQKWLQ